MRSVVGVALGWLLLTLPVGLVWGHLLRRIGVAAEPDAPAEQLDAAADEGRRDEDREPAAPQPARRPSAR